VLLTLKNVECQRKDTASQWRHFAFDFGFAVILVYSKAKSIFTAEFFAEFTKPLQH
jgi:hypothetical protein